MSIFENKSGIEKMLDFPNENEIPHIKNEKIEKHSKLL